MLKVSDYNTMKKINGSIIQAKRLRNICEKPFDLKILRTDIDKYLESD